MLTFLNNVGAALLVPLLVNPAPKPDCQLDRLVYVSADDRAIGQFVAATHDYVAYGRHGALINERAAEIFRFRLRVSRWAHRLDATQALADPRAGGRTRLGAPGVAAAALPELPDEIEYRLSGAHLLLVDRRTNAVIDLLPHAFGERWGRWQDEP